ncbi:MAG: hypothetical protein ACT4NY_28920 [Pseudonocardiales bacterium]
MVANGPSASPSSWIPMSRALSAVFAGSAVMFGAALLQGGSLLSHEDVRPATEPVVGRTDIPPATVTAKIPASDAAPAAPIMAPNQAAPWTPGATPDWGGPLRDLPVQRAPVQSAPQREAPAPPDAEDPEPAQGASVQPTDDDPNRGTLGDVLDYIGP